MSRTVYYKRPYQHTCKQCPCGFRIEQPFYDYDPEPRFYILPLAGVEWHPAGENNDAFCTGEVEVIWEETAPPWEEDCEDLFANPFEQDLDPYRDLILSRELLPPFMYDNKNGRMIFEFPEMLPFDVSIEKLKLYLLLS